jgi:hypothetical protein
MKKKTFMFTVMVILAVSIGCSAVEKEKETVKKVIVDAYINGFFLKGDAEAIEKGFHPKCEIVRFRYIDINKQPISHWLDHYKKYPGPSYKDARYQFCSLTVAERIANAVVEVQATKELTFTAHFSLFKLKEGWKIVSQVDYRHGYRVPKDRKVAQVAPAVYDAYIGRYTTRQGLELTVTRSGNRLFIQDPVNREMEFFPESETTFFSKVVESTVTFEKDKKGVVTKLRLRSHTAEDGKSREIAARRLIPKVAAFSGKIKHFKMSEVMAGPFDSRQSALKQYGNQLPDDLVIAPASPKGMVKGWFLVKSEPIVSTKDLESVNRGMSPHGEPAISLSFKPESAEKMKAYTTANRGKRLAIMLDHQVISAPVIGGVISKDSMITGHFTMDEVSELIVQLKIAINKN